MVKLIVDGEMQDWNLEPRNISEQSNGYKKQVLQVMILLAMRMNNLFKIQTH